MTRTAGSLLGWVLASAMVITLSFVCVMQWQELQGAKPSTADAVSGNVSRLLQRIELADSRWSAALQSLTAEQVRLRDLLKVRNTGNGHGETLPPEQPQIGGPGPDSLVQADPGESELPALPQGVIPEHVVSKEFMEVLSDPLLNPTQKKLTMVEASKVRLELARAQGLTNILDSEIKLEYNLGMEKLRAEGSFIEYQNGEKYQTFDGVLTAAQPIPGGIRMFYFYPEQYPQIYEKKSQRKEISTIATRRIVGILAE